MYTKMTADRFCIQSSALLGASGRTVFAPPCQDLGGAVLDRLKFRQAPVKETRRALQ